MASGETGVLAIVPFPCTLDSAQIAMFNVESSPFLALTLSRFITGTGFTSFVIGSTFPAQNFGTSGWLLTGVSLPASGSTTLQLMANDVLGYIVGGTGGTAIIAGGVAGAFVLRAVQDVRSTLFTGGD